MARFSGLIHAAEFQLNPSASLLFWGKHDTFILFALDDLEGMVKVFLARLNGGGVLLVSGQVGVDELYQAVEVLGRDLRLLALYA